MVDQKFGLLNTELCYTIKSCRNLNRSELFVLVAWFLKAHSHLWWNVAASLHLRVQADKHELAKPYRTSFLGTPKPVFLLGKLLQRFFRDWRNMLLATKGVQFMLHTTSNCLIKWNWPIDKKTRDTNSKYNFALWQYSSAHAALIKKEKDKFIGKYWNIWIIVKVGRSVTTTCLGHSKQNLEVMLLTTTKMWRTSCGIGHRCG